MSNSGLVSVAVVIDWYWRQVVN